MVDGEVRTAQKGIIGRVAGAVTGRVVDVVDPDIVLDRVDLNSLLDKVDLQRVLERVDLNPVLSDVDLDALLARVDVQALLTRVDLDAVLLQVDLDALLARVDLNQLLADVDLEALVQRSGIPEVVAESTSRMATSALDVGRRQIAAFDFWINHVVARLLRRPPGSYDEAPPALAPAASTEDEDDDGRREVTGHYAGPVARLLAFAFDSLVVTLVYTGTVATVDWLVRILFDQTVVGQLPGWLSAVMLALWAFVYFFGTLAIAGRTLGMALVGLRVVATEGTTLSPLSALKRTLCEPLSFLFFGLGLVGIVVGKRHRALHDVAGGSVVVVDFGDRPAELPGPLSRFLDRRGL
jgi:uncharacterized RDD family membrane protein YckC